MPKLLLTVFWFFPNLDWPNDPKENELLLFWFIELFKSFGYELELPKPKPMLLFAPNAEEFNVGGWTGKVNSFGSILLFAKVTWVDVVELKGWNWLLEDAKRLLEANGELFVFNLLSIISHLFKLGFYDNFWRFASLSSTYLIIC